MGEGILGGFLPSCGGDQPGFKAGRNVLLPSCDERFEAAIFGGCSDPAAAGSELGKGLARGG